MKKLILIVLIVCFVVTITAPVLSKVSFGGWDRWDEQLPPADNESWYWAIKTNEPRTMTLKNFGGLGNDVVVLFSDIWFFASKSGKIKATAFFYSQGGNIDVKDWDIPNADLAIVAFPVKKGEVIIRTYKMEGEMKDRVFKFFEEWKIAFKDHEIIVPLEVKFYKEFENWLRKISSRNIISEDIVNFMLPKLRILNKNDFVLNEGEYKK